MSEIAVVAVTLAALAVVVLVVRVLFVVRRVQRVWERLDRTIESDLGPGIRAWGEAGRGVQQAAGKLDAALVGLVRIVQRLDRLSEKLDAGLVMGSAVGKLSSWLAGVRRGLARPHHHQHVRTKGSAEPEGEGGEPGD